MKENSTELKAISKSEFIEIVEWFSTAPIVPSEMKNNLGRLIAVYSNLIEGERRAKQTLHQLRMAMGFTPKSERGSQEKHAVGI